jgi:REJ domain
LNSQWTCSIVSLKNLGADCGTLVLDPSKSSSNKIVIPSNSMKLQTTYAFVVAVSSLDGRSDSKTILITPEYTGDIKLIVKASLTRFNPGSKLIVSGRVLAPFTVTSVWSVLSPLGVALPFPALTAPQTNLSFSSPSNYIAFPIAFIGGTFTAGSSYSFRLSAYPAGNTKKGTYTEITLKANSHPTSGYLMVEPRSGTALTTQFLVTAPGWTAEAENLPLRYSFSYTVSTTLSKYLTLKSSSLKAYTTTTLPPGLSALKNVITVRSKVTDNLLSSSTATGNVTVTVDPSVDLTRTLNSSLTAALAVGNINLIYQTVNNVS